MSRFFPHPAYAEDQPLSRTLLTTHVVVRTITASTIIAGGITTVRQIVPFLRPKVPALAFTPRLIHSASTGTLIALGLGALMTAGRMHGREEIEWKDRSWRLLENKGQVETDDWTLGGVTAGAILGASTAKSMGLGWRGAVGGIGLGSVAGMIGYLGWRYGVKGGKFPETEL